jgi:hypothetical protein
MAKGQQRDLKREAFWRGTLARFGSSGLSVRRFCARERVSEPCFYSWRRVIQERDREPKRGRPAFLPVLVHDDVTGQGGGGIVIEVCGGPRSVALRLPPAMPVGQVAELVRAIEAAPTPGRVTAEARA